MTTLAALFERNIVAVFFVYGLAFFSMGLAILLESRRASEFRIARAMGFLAAFGLLHGVHEWLRMAEEFGGPSSSADSASILLGNIDVTLLALSFLFLAVFGARLIYADDEGRTFPILLGVTLFLIWVASVFAIRRVFEPCPVDCLGGIDVLTRYMLGLPGGLLAAWAMLLEQRAFRIRGMHSVGRDLLWAALAMFLYGFVGQIFTERSFLFPSTVINADLFVGLFGIPIQLFRASTAAVIAVFVIRALRAFELESRQRLAVANKARLTAQREALDAQRRARAETEQLNRELQAAVQDLSTLFELSRSLASTLDRTALMEQAISRIAGSLPRIGAGMILLRERPDGPLQVVASSGFVSEPGGDGLPTEERARRLGAYVADAGYAAASIDGRIVELDRTADLAAPAGAAPEDGLRTVGIPLEIQNHVAGSLVLSARSDAPALTSRDISLCRTIASQLGIALENANLYREVQARDALRGEMLHRVVSAQEAERQRIARELHDETGQALTALGLGLAAASESVKVDPARTAEQLAELRTLSSQAITELHELVADLRPSVLDDLGLVPALRRQAQDFESRTHVEAAFTVEGGHRRTRPEVETVLFRIAQEALTNVAKHARASRVSVSLVYSADEVVLTVADNGQGFDADRVLRGGGGSRNRRAWGLLGIQERVALVGGAVRVESQPGIGTTIRVRIPLRDEGAQNEED